MRAVVSGRRKKVARSIPREKESREIARNERNRDWSTIVEKKGCNNSVP